MKAVWLVVCGILLYGPLVADGADTVREPPALPGSLVGKTLAWQLHWDQRVKTGVTVQSKVTFRARDQWEVLVEPLEWIISFNYRGTQPFPNHLLRLSEVPVEVRRQDVEPFASLPKSVVVVPRYEESFRRISSYRSDVRQRLLACFEAEACAKESVSSYAGDDGKPVKDIRFWIAPVDVHFPVIMYFVEGVPYIGRIYFDTRSTKPIYAELNYITEAGSRSHQEGLKLMSAIKAEGDSFDFKDGRLIQAPH